MLLRALIQRFLLKSDRRFLAYSVEKLFWASFGARSIRSSPVWRNNGSPNLYHRFGSFAKGWQHRAFQKNMIAAVTRRGLPHCRVWVMSGLSRAIRRTTAFSSYCQSRPEARRPLPFSMDPAGLTPFPGTLSSLLFTTPTTIHPEGVRVAMEWGHWREKARCHSNYRSSGRT